MDKKREIVRVMWGPTYIYIYVNICVALNFGVEIKKKIEKKKKKRRGDCGTSKRKEKILWNAQIFFKKKDTFFVCSLIWLFNNI